jgi:molybdate transport system ATP-binding protein
VASALRAELALTRGEFDLEASLAVGAGECVALVGSSGAGKSTLLRALAGLLRPRTGRITLGESVWLDRAAGVDMPAERRGVGFVFQEYALFPGMSAWRNVAYGIRGGGRRERRRRAGELLERFGLSARAGAHPGELSGGERQRVALARALASEPRVLILDEPLSALDVGTRRTASRELGHVLAAAEIPSLIVTHDFAEAALLADRVAVLDRGRIVQEGTPAELAAAPASAFVADLSGAVVLRGVARGGEDGLTIVDLDGGGRLSSVDEAAGPVAASVFPWEIALERLGAGGPPQGGSVLNHLRVEVTSVSEFGNRARIGLASPQPLAAEVTSGSARRLGLAPGTWVEASWKATATRLSPL